MDPAETEVLPQKRRGRKRKKIDGQDVASDFNSKRKTVETRSLKLVGRYVIKEFQENGVFLGKITFYEAGLYRINYEDGDCEDLYSREVKSFLVEDGDLVGEWSERREKLDKFLLETEVKAKVSEAKDALELVDVSHVDSSLLSVSINVEANSSEMVEVCDDGNVDNEADSSSDSCEDAQEGESNLDMEDTHMPPPELPPSSGHIGVSDEYVSQLLSVYSFLRSFSIPLFLYPFGLDDFVGALNCSVANTLLDSVHIALLHVLKRHLERLSSEGSELALKCLRCLDWNLLDTITWPVYLVHYLIVMSCDNAPQLKGFYTHFLGRDYYTLSAGNKLIILQMLCDHVLDSAELRAEMDMREELEVGIDIDSSTASATTDEPRRFHPRYSKTSASKNIEAMRGVAVHHQIKPPCDHSNKTGGPVGSSAEEDGNGDECRICGIEGLLICCDGCPSSYHTRCLGLNKMHMPEGTWYCPECKINSTQPKILQGTTLRGGQCFGVDPFGQAFVASCDHLLVLDASINSEVCLRYYNRHDVPKVLHSLYSKRELAVRYSEICRGIMQYWELPECMLSCFEVPEVGLLMAHEKGGNEVTTHLDNLTGNLVMEPAEVGKSRSCVTGVSAVNVTNSSLTTCVGEPVLSGGSLDTGNKSDLLNNTGSTRLYSCSMLNPVLQKSPSFNGVAGSAADTNELSQQSASSVNGIASFAGENDNIDHSDPVNGSSRESKLSLLFQHNRVAKMSYQCSDYGCLYKGSSFKTTGYINNYAHGDFAASAALNLTVLSSEENPVSENRPSNNRRKVMSGNISLQVKAFSSMAMRFFWPYTEKKLFEVPRERCSWCYSCKATVSSKRGCLLNAAASNATRGATKVPAGVRYMKCGDARLAGIAAYIMFMEESLSGLVGGPFLNDPFRKRWRKLVEPATTCNVIKILLLELEQNIRTVALSGDWIKLVDSSVQPSTSQIAANAAGTAQKCRSGRRGRRSAAVTEVTSVNLKDTLPDFTWWRGGALSKLMLQRGILPHYMISKAARKGGLKKITGIQYVEGLEAPRMSRQLIWRSAVEMSRNMAQLALQVRQLDFHLRWSDLVRPEQNLLDGKGLDTEVSAFRNAFICDKKTVGHEIRYCVAFGSQKHLPSRVMKYIAEVEQILDDGKERYWFSETRIPLYLIREYEEKVEKNKPMDVLSKLQRRQRKGTNENIFSYLWRKQDNMHKSFCCSCHGDVFHRNAVKCSACQGSCHVQCATGSTVDSNKDVEFLMTCKKCCESRAITHVQSSYGSPTSPLLLQTQDLPNGSTSNKHVASVTYKQKQPPAPVGTLKFSSKKRSINGSAVTKNSKNKHWGLIWKKKNDEDNGADFRLKNILLKGNLDGESIAPICRLCSTTYNPDLMYICCEKCQGWFHADAVELDESKIFLLMGFKCSRCRRIKSPVCPYLDLEKKKALEYKMESKAPKSDSNTMDNDSRLLPKHLKEGLTSFPLPEKREFHRVAADDPLLSSVAEVVQCANTRTAYHESNNFNISHSGPGKLPVRRHTKPDNGIDYSLQTDPFQVGVSALYEANPFNSSEKLPVRRQIKGEDNSNGPLIYPLQVEACNSSEANDMNTGQGLLSPQAQWITSEEGDMVDDMITLDYDDYLGFEDTEFEPQTYFSYDELLAFDDGGLADESDSLIIADNEMLEISYDREEPIISVGTSIEVTPCKFCTRIEPHPDVCCQACGMWLHSHCSPWLETSCWEDGWRCGNCRDWR